MIEATNKGKIEVIYAIHYVIVKGYFEGEDPQIKRVDLSLFGIVELIEALKKDKNDKVIQIGQAEFPKFHIGRSHGIREGQMGIQFPAKGAWESNLLTVPLKEFVDELVDRLADSLKCFE